MDIIKNEAKKSWIRFLEKSIDQYDKVLLFKQEEIAREFCQSESAKFTYQKILILSPKKIELNTKNIIFHQISKEEIEQVTDFYFTYEFSDKFLFVSRENINYAGLFYFVDTGILSMEEAFEALICQHSVSRARLKNNLCS